MTLAKPAGDGDDARIRPGCGIVPAVRQEKPVVNQNPYAPPSMDADKAVRRIGRSETLPWFAVGTRKLMVMSVLTIGLYSLYWFERQYRFQRRTRRESTWPLARATFSIFFAHELFRRVEGAASQADIQPSWTSGTMGILFVTSAVVGRLCERLSGSFVTGPTSTSLSLFGLFSVLGLAYPIVQVQGTVNRLLELERSDYDKNERVTVWNWLIIATGAVVLALAIFGYVSDSDGEAIPVAWPAHGASRAQMITN
jgi:hypothetical protein